MRFLVFIIITLCSSAALSNDNLKDVKFNISSGSINHSRLVIDYSLYRSSDLAKTGAYSDGFVKKTIKRSIDKMNLFLSKKNLKPLECRGIKQKIKIYYISSKLLNDRSRFSLYGLENPNINEKTNLIGFYDPTRYDVRSDSIIVTNISSKRNSSLLAHEFSHYIYNRYCIMAQTYQNTEPFAIEFEKFYSEDL